MEKERFKQKVLELISKRTLMTDLRDHIEVERVITPLDWEEKHRVYLGATFNLSHKFSQLFYLRPRNRFEELAICYLVGEAPTAEADFQPSMNRQGFHPTVTAGLFKA